VTPRVLVTGGAGFIGSHVAGAYLAAGWDVTVLDDLSTGRRGYVPAAAHFVRGDVRSAEARELVAGGRFALVNHHAAQVDVRRSVREPLFDADVNLLGLLNVLEGARAGGVRRVVFASSGGAIYGDGVERPTAEEALKSPSAPYGVAKLAAEYYLRVHASLHGIETVALRYANVYGPRQDPLGEGGAVAIFLNRALQGEPLLVFGDGEQTRDLVFVQDVAAANVAAAVASLRRVGGVDAHAFNVGTGSQTSVNALAHLAAETAGRPATIRHQPARPGEIRHSALQIARAERELGWRAPTSLAHGLRLTAAWVAGQSPVTTPAD
jgi:UDP-glucose 4-epimerase